MPLADGSLNTGIFRRQHHRTGEQASRQDGAEDKSPGSRAMERGRRHSSTFDLIQVY